MFCCCFTFRQGSTEFPDTLIKEGTLSCVDYLQMSGVSGDSTDTLAEGGRGDYPWMSGITLDIL